MPLYKYSPNDRLSGAPRSMGVFHSLTHESMTFHGAHFATIANTDPFLLLFDTRAATNAGFECHLKDLNFWVEGHYWDVELVGLGNQNAGGAVYPSSCRDDRPDVPIVPYTVVRLPTTFPLTGHTLTGRFLLGAGATPAAQSFSFRGDDSEAEWLLHGATDLAGVCLDGTLLRAFNFTGAASDCCVSWDFYELPIP